MALTFTITTLFLTSILYFTGWMYLYYYLAEFGFSIFEASIPFHYVLVYSFAVLDGYFSKAITNVLGILGFVFVYMALLAFCDSQVRRPQKVDGSQFLSAKYTYPIGGSILLAAVLFSFWEARSAAEISARYQANILRENPQPHFILLTEAARQDVLNFAAQTSIAPVKTFLIQDSGTADWQDRVVDIALADKNTFFLILSQESSNIEIPIRVKREDVSFIGAPSTLVEEASR